MTTSEVSVQAMTSHNGILPQLDDTTVLSWDRAIAGQQGIYGFDSRDMRSRPFNLLRSRIAKLYHKQGWRLFGIVSATPGVGKSFIATNVAASISRTPGLTTYLIDFDLRRGSIAKNFGHEQAVGLRAYLEGDADALRNAAFTPEGEHLIVIPTDSAPVHSAELLAGEPMRELLEAMRRQEPESIFLCDLPPVFANDDAAIVTAGLDAYFLVVENGQTTRKQIRDSIEVLDRAVCAGVILNRYSGGLISDSYGYNYGPNTGYGAYYKNDE